MSPAGSSQCSVNVLGEAAVCQCAVEGGVGGGTLGRDPRRRCLRGGQKRPLLLGGAWWSGRSAGYANPAKERQARRNCTEDRLSFCIFVLFTPAHLFIWSMLFKSGGLSVVFPLSVHFLRVSKTSIGWCWAPWPWLWHFYESEIQHQTKLLFVYDLPIITPPRQG